MGFVVNNTTKCGPLDLLCPHTCRSCGCLGAVLCERCKKYIISQREIICPICKKSFAKIPEKVANMQKESNLAKNELNKTRSEINLVENELSEMQGLSCEDCEMPFDGLWAFGWREGVVKKLIEQYKYQSVRAMGEVLTEMLDVAIPDAVGENVVIVPLPTIGRHVRERGLDHTGILAKKLAKRRGWQVQRVLKRVADTVQVGAKVAEREAQAKKAYIVQGKIDREAQYVLLDDVWTTGASMLAAAEVMRKAGVKSLYGVVVGVSRVRS